MLSETRIILVGHAEVELANPPIFAGRVDLNLTARGLRQADRTRDYLRSFRNVVAVYAGPLSQCQRTARIVADGFGLAPGFAAELNNRSYGDWECKSHDEIAQNDPERYRYWQDSPDQVLPPRAEKLEDIKNRAANAWRRVLADHKGQTAILVGHEIIIRLFLADVLSFPIDQAFSPEQFPCSISRVQHNDAGWKMASLYETAHLGAERSELW